jgi:hypothetical protein
MQRTSHQCRLGDLACFNEVRQMIALKIPQARPQTHIRRGRLLRLQAHQLLDCLRHTHLNSFQEKLAR